MLNEDSLTPLYQQMMAEIKSKIEDGEYAYNEKIPSEEKLGKEYSVSRITVRRAIDELCTEGYLIKKQGKGTFVDKKKMHRKLEKTSDVLSFSEACRAVGMIPGARVIKRSVCIVHADERKFFGVPEDTPILYIQRVLSADGTPIQIENNYYPYTKFKFLMEEPLENGSLFALLREKYGINVCNTSKTLLEVVRAKGEKAELLDVLTGEPLFYQNCYFIDENEEPLFIGRQYIAGNRYVFNL
ncbi:GntR family transcriptional regulator [Ruminiclostridium sufflavum DSM 19573]|uniref:GntR family transcriptional regulator n=1 Tax=Ruminiclostridium sufflavum DSM 19573 TaxID=1121337 RepID=A0A318XH57_9FIRM|nr:GntR family transcriptional regulator [Ruminiclostridium sufflavum]PYG85915.1 GntR family transcriptional regulator [Ruminiclostridium sufflavum DSM 19573]